MAVEVLRPQDPLRNRLHPHTSPFHRRRNFTAAGNIPNLTFNRRNHPNSSQQKAAQNTNGNTSPKPDKKKIKKSPKSPQGGEAAVGNAKLSPVVGQVTILKRGESLASISHDSRVENPNSNLNSKSSSTPNLSPIPNFNLKIKPSVNKLGQLNVSDVYAGSGFVISPSPRSLPVPSFFKKKESSDDASENLKRLLRLDELIH